MTDPPWLRRSLAVLVGLVAAIATQLIFVSTFVPGIVSSLGEGPEAQKAWAAAADSFAFLLGIAVVAADGGGSFRLRR